ncbi:MAG: DUF2752 domain-containing protein [Bacteroidales bacterium]|jgi:hypothetical protein
MTPLKKRTSLLSEYWSVLHSDPYLKINVIFAGVVVLVMAYSGIFSPDRNNYPVVCIHEKITGMKCFSCGLSHSFSLIVRGRISEAYRWNAYGMQVFLFFLLQLVMRIAFSAFYITGKNYRKQLILYDITGSIIIFLLAFYPFFRQLVLELIHSLR